MNKIKKIIRKVINKIFIFLAVITRTNLITVWYKQNGILNYENDTVSGEDFFIKKILKRKIKKNDPIFFDVGSNIGSYSLLLRKEFPKSTIYSFEPNPYTYKKIEEEALNKNIKFYNIGLYSKSGSNFIYDYKDRSGTQHASIYEKIITDIHSSDSVEKIESTYETLDNFCYINNINKIDFIKIDTEGSEFDVLLGSKKMLEKNCIDIIQFEFNEMNVISRVFLKDYYELLSGYDIYRLSSKCLIPMPIYDTKNEIFKFQNIVAINKLLK